ncbi:hypothetical protein EJB05_45922, partial [Eragrostis curvula]
MPLWGVGGLSAAVSSRLRRGLSMAAASRPQWAMVYHAPLVCSSAPRPSLQLFEPPCASRLPVPFHLVDPQPGPDAGSDSTRRFHGGNVHVVSGDGLLFLDFTDIRGMDLVAAGHAMARAAHLGVDMGSQDPDVMRFFCNPLSGEVFRLPDAGGTKKDPTLDSHGLITHSARGHGSPDRYAIAELRMSVDYHGEALIYIIRRQGSGPRWLARSLTRGASDSRSTGQWCWTTMCWPSSAACGGLT